MRPDGNPYNAQTSGDGFRFSKLNGQNYATWAVHMENALASKYLWMIVDGSEVCPAKPTFLDPLTLTDAECAAHREFLDWTARDKAASGIIRNGCEVSQWPHTIACKTSKEVWDMLQQFHRDNQIGIDVHYYFGELFTHKYVDGASMADHIVAIRDLQHKIMAAGETVPDLYVARALILSLPKTLAWEVIKIRLLSVTQSAKGRQCMCGTPIRGEPALTRQI